MTRLSVFQFGHYKSIMKHFLRSEGTRGALSRAADALGCQRSYLSRVMNSEVHLTLDQAFLLTRHWDLTSLESDYFRALVEFDRASDRDYREAVQLRIQELRKAHESLSEKVRRPVPQIASAEQALYFSSWIWTALHFLTSTPGGQTADKLAHHIGLPSAQVVTYLEQLSQMKMVRKEGSRWLYNGGEYHLPNHSPFVLMHHQNWRAKALLDAQNFQTDGLHYTNVQTVSHEDFKKGKELFLQFIEGSKKVFDPSEPEIAVAVTCDIFQI